MTQNHMFFGIFKESELGLQGQKRRIGDELEVVKTRNDFGGFSDVSRDQII